MDKIAVIVPVYNRQAFIRTALISLIDQRSDEIDIHIIVVDDGSTDDSRNIIEQVKSEFGDINLISVSNGGISKARNIGLENVPDGTNYISFLDSDDISPSGRFALDLKCFQENPDLDFTYGRMLICRFELEGSEQDIVSKGENVRSIQLAALLITVDYAKKVGMFREDFAQAEDTDYLLRVFEQSQKYVRVETLCVFYRRHDDNISLHEDINLKYFMRAIHASIVRRRKNPELKLPVGIFSNDVNKLRL